MSMVLTSEEKPSGERRWRAVAAVCGLLGALLAILVPLLPVWQTSATVQWDGREDITLPLAGYLPSNVELQIPCSTGEPVAGGGEQVVVSTAPVEAGAPARSRGLLITSDRDGLTVRSHGDLIASIEKGQLQGCSLAHVVIDDEHTRITLDAAGPSGGDSVVADLEGDFRPQVVGVFSSLPEDAREGLAAHLVVDSRYTTAPSAVKIGAVAAGVALMLASWWALLRLDGPIRRPSWGRVPRIGALDAVVGFVVVFGYVLGANTSDDGYIFTQARAAAQSGYMTEYFRYFAAPYAPFGMPFYLYTWLENISPSSLVVRLPTLFCALGSWWLLSRHVVPRLGGRAAQSTIARATAAGVFLAFWLTFNNGIRPEPIISFGVLATWVLLERCIATRRLAPLAGAFIIGGLTLSAAPTGTFCLVVLLAGARPVADIIRTRIARHGAVPTLAPLAAAGLSTLFLVFWDITLRTVAQSTALLGAVGPSGSWHDETQRYEWLFNVNADGSLTRRFAVLAMFLCLAIVVASLLRHGTIPGLRPGPVRRLAIVGVLSILAMSLNPTKWTHHFGAFAAIAAMLAAAAAIATLPAVLSRTRDRLLLYSAVSMLCALAFQGPNAWWYVSIFGIPFGGEPPEIAGIGIGTLLALAGVALAIAAVIVDITPAMRYRMAANTESPRRAIVDAPLSLASWAIVTLIVFSTGYAVANQYPAFTVGLSNLRALGGNPCALGDAVLAEPDPNSGLLSPIGPNPHGLPADEQSVFTPNGIPNDLDATNTSSESAQSADPGRTRDERTSTGGTGGGQRAEPGINGSTVALPFGLDPQQVPVLGSHHDTDTGRDVSVSTDWYKLREPHPDRPLVTVAVAGHVSADSLEVSAGRISADGEVTELGHVPIIDPGPTPSWRNIRIPVDTLPPGTDSIRLTATDDDRGPETWIGFTAPRMPTLVPMQHVVGDAPVLPDWGVAFYVPCMRPFSEYAGVTEIPAFRILPDRDLAAVTDNWQAADGGGPLGITKLLTSAETIPTYLAHDWDRDWGALERLTPLAPGARPAPLHYDTHLRSGLWNGGGALPK